MQGGEETILLVEDDSIVRAMMIVALRELGYNVLEASNGVVALQLAEEYTGGDIHLLLSDIVMPLMNGIELARHFIALYPRTGILLMSGYVDEAEASASLPDSGIEFLRKPFSIPELAEKVRQVLDQ